MRLIGELAFYTLLILLPVNLAKHFPAFFSYLSGVLVDYYLPTLYLTDLLVWTVLFSWGGEILGRERKAWRERLAKFSVRRQIFSPSLKEMLYLVLALFLLFSHLSLLAAQEKEIALYRLVRLDQYILLALWIGTHVDLRRDFSKLSSCLAVGFFYEGLLAILQWVAGGTIFGFYFLGEPEFSAALPGAAKVNFLGEVRARVYGTLPHPNILGAYLAFLLPWLIFLREERQGRAGWLKLFLGVGALFFTFSRAAWAAAALAILFLGKRLRERQRALFFSLAGVFLFFFVFFGSLNDPFSWQRRRELAETALRMLKAHPFLGVGFGNFIFRMEEYGQVSGWLRFLQPVHNLFLLVGAETGIFGLLTFGAFFSLLFLFLWRRQRRLRREYSLSPPAGGPVAATLQLLLERNGQRDRQLNFLLIINFFQILLFALSDHYLWTLPQGALIFWLYVGLVFSLRG